MAKGFGKFLAGAVIAGAAAAGVYYLLKAKDDEDDFDDFDDDVNDDLEDFLKEETSDTEKSKREYVPLNFSKDKVDAAGEKVVGSMNKAADAAADAAEGIVKEAKAAADGASEFKFTDLTGAEK